VLRIRIYGFLKGLRVGDEDFPMFHHKRFVVSIVGGCVVNVVKLW
jgi:hypothetical protein